MKDEGTRDIVSSLIQRLHRIPGWVAVVFLLLLSLLVACGGATTSGPSATAVASTPVAAAKDTNLRDAPVRIQSTETPTPALAKSATTTDPSSGLPPVGKRVTMGEAALGGRAETTLIANQVVLEVPNGELVWVAYEAEIPPGKEVEHSHGFAFVYAKSGRHFLRGSGEEWELLPGEGASIFSGLNHRHGSATNDSTFWEVSLSEPKRGGIRIPSEFRLLFQSEPLEDVPTHPLAVFTLVRLQQGGQTSVHTHPGPELTYQLTGKINYENAIIGAKQMGPGEFEGIPAGTAVQKRNPFEEVAEFFSWFLVDGTKPFAPAARFEPLIALGENRALIARGARVVGVSSNFAGGGVDSAFGASNALDGDPSSEWSSDGDGNHAWIEIALPEKINITSIGVWSRTMGVSAEISTFRLVDELGGIAGPFTLYNATEIHHFNTNFKTRRLRFEVIDSSGGNTGLIEIQIFGDPIP